MVDTIASPQLSAQAKQPRPRWSWFSQSGWRGWRDPNSPGGDWGWLSSVLEGKVSAEILNDREGSRTFRVELPTPDGPSDTPDQAAVGFDSRVVYLKYTSCSLRYGLTHFAQPQAWRVSWVMSAMHRRGLGVPALRCAATRISRRGFENVVVMDALAGRSLTDFMTEFSGATTTKALQSAASASARLHDLGFAHGDLVPGNLFLTGMNPSAGDAERPAVVFIDNDRTRRVWGVWRFRARFRNVSQSCFRIRGCMGWGGARVFLRRYLQDMKGWEIEKRWVRRAVIRKMAQRSKKRPSAN